MSVLERCYICDEPTGRAGRCDDSIFVEIIKERGFDLGEEVGPLCEECCNDLTHEGVIEKKGE